MRGITVFLFALSVPISQTGATATAQIPTRQKAVAALAKAVQFFHTEVASHGGYVWKYSDDLVHRQGEGLADENTIWVQPPGTPAVGLALMDAYGATGDRAALDAARDAAQALVQGQLHSGGWNYSVTFDHERRREFNYRQPPSKGKPDVRIDPSEPGGWDVWRQRRYKSNMTLLDDDTTQSALRLLMRVDEALEFRDAAIHEATAFGLASVRKAQYPVGAWSHNYDRFPRAAPDADYYPVKAASFPETWSRTWTKRFAGCYMLNDRITLDAIKTMLDAHRIYGNQEYRDAALRGGDFLLRAQMPAPQRAWAQQYDRQMQPVWDRPFEPPAISGFESQDAIDTLRLLYERTAEKKYLVAAQEALKYLRSVQLPDGKLARFYELKTSRPLYFTKDYKVTYDRGQMPEHYALIVDSRLDAIADRLQRVASDAAVTPAPRVAGDLAADVRRIIDSMDPRGAWLEPGWVRNSDGKKVTPAAGIINSQTFIDNVSTLCRYLGN